MFNVLSYGLLFSVMNELDQFVKLESEIEKQAFYDYLERIIFQQKEESKYQLIFDEITYYLSVDCVFLLKKNECPLYTLLELNSKIKMDTDYQLTILLLINLELKLKFKSKYLYDLLIIDDKYFDIISCPETIMRSLLKFNNNMISSKVADAIKISWLISRPYGPFEKITKKWIKLLVKFIEMYPYSLRGHWLNIDINEYKIKAAIANIKNKSLDELKEIEYRNRKLHLLENGILRIPQVAKIEFGIELTLPEKYIIGKRILNRYKQIHKRPPEKVKIEIDGKLVSICKYSLADYQIIYDSLEKWRRL